ncbi:PREDICTED: metabotropic glutamate receptor 7 isoform X2 [Nicrophorus vespilloides]|uniref:Metabotropic glutamate receptor 7 isoform X2 n=1 Tax=Nicrophorus vespilloides TaxID=110193 RepID=A0ABM1MEG9_NICVS|nr:PREDICTED: metabotropic glutamate receptor 7 isoform X2 [Nicrophorus vespilloides]
MSEYKCASGGPPMYVPHKPVTAVIGASFSVVSIMVANILRLFKVPQISYASTSTELSDKSRFEYFSRVVPPDSFQAQAMVSIIKELGWKYVSTVAVEGEYGEKGIASFISYSTAAGICIATTEKIQRNSRLDDFDRIIEKLIQKPQARAVILFVDEDNTRKLLQATIRANKTSHFLWIGSDSWGAKVHPVRDQEFAAEGAITILPHRNAIKGFDRYYSSLRPKMDKEKEMCNSSNGRNIPLPSGKTINCRNVWFKEFWSQHNKCSFEDENNGNEDDVKPCTGVEMMEDYDQEGLVPFVVDAVYAAAHAIHDIVADRCDEPFHLCEELRPTPAGSQVLKYIRNVTFTGKQKTEVKFNSDGDAYGSYNIYQYQKHEDGKYDYKQIGSWKEVLDLKLEHLEWRDRKDIPTSICSHTCPSGHIRNYQDQCCWICVACREDAFVFNDTCRTCPPGYAPNLNKTGCIKLEALVIDWMNAWALAPLIFSGIGISLTLFTTCVFIRYNRTPVIMASGRELCYVLLFGICSCYSMSFVILAEPTVETCAIMRIGLGLCLSICYSAIFTKTNRISRIFNRGVKSIKRPVYTSPISQVAISLGIVSIQLVGSIIWLVIDRPDIREIYPYPLTAVLTCRVSTYSLILSLGYNMILILLCTWYAFKTRKIPENFNEAKYIGFTMYSTCIVWLAFLPIYFGTNNDYKIQIVSVCMCLNISASVVLGCLFVPKVYLVLFQPYKNVRQTGNGNQMFLFRVAPRIDQHTV